MERPFAREAWELLPISMKEKARKAPIRLKIKNFKIKRIKEKKGDFGLPSEYPLSRWAPNTQMGSTWM